MPNDDKLKDAAINAGRALDAALHRILTNDMIHILKDPLIVNDMHNALNQIVFITGKPWRKESDGR